MLPDSEVRRGRIVSPPLPHSLQGEHPFESKGAGEERLAPLLVVPARVSCDHWASISRGSPQR